MNFFSILKRFGLINLIKFIFFYLIVISRLNKKFIKLNFLSKKKINESTLSKIKYLDYKKNIFSNLIRIFNVNIHNSKNKLNILDISTGPGYFAYLCKFFGHSIECTDIDNHSIYVQIRKVLRLNVKYLRIKKYKKFKLNKKYNLITSHLITFNDHRNDKIYSNNKWSYNKKSKKKIWDVMEWKFFIENLKKYLKPNGIIYLEFNKEKNQSKITNYLKKIAKKNKIIILIKS